MKTAPWYAGWSPVEFTRCYVDGCRKEHDDSIVQVPTYSVKMNSPMFVSSINDQLRDGDETRRTRMEALPMPSIILRGDIIEYLEVVEGDAGKTLFGMSLAERIGMCYWNSTRGDWIWR